MTVIVGLLCRDGLVIGSDSQESDDDLGMKRLDVKKIYDAEKAEFAKQKDFDLIVAGTGETAYIDRVVTLIGENSLAPRFTLPRQVADVVEKSLGQLKRRYGDELDVEVLAGVHCRSCAQTGDPPPSPIGLYSVSAPEEKERIGVAEEIKDYEALGTGGLFARYLLNRLHDEDNPPTALPMDAAIREIIYVIGEVSKVDLWCGGGIQVVYLEKKGSSFELKRKKKDEVSKILGDLDSSDSHIKREQRRMFSG